MLRRAPIGSKRRPRTAWSGATVLSIPRDVQRSWIIALAIDVVVQLSRWLAG
jgi:hypothetical protein